ncbi:MAG: diacylglycerol/lipid kinase family protein [Hyphomicrobiales bacterium]
MTDSRPLFIVNPASGGGRTRGRLDRLRAAIERHGLEADIVLTEAPWHAHALATDAIEAGRDTLVACGGDGTVFEVANAIMDAGANGDVRLGTVPLGTGKDVGKCLGIGRPAAGLRAVAAGAERRIDLGRVDCFDPNGAPITRYFVLEAAAGWIPEISHSVPRRLKLLGDTAPYVIMTFVRMLGPMNRPFEVAIDGESFDGDHNSISVHNMAYWGGDLEVAPDARPDDGVLDVIRWGPLGRSKVLQAVQGQRNGGTHLQMDGIDLSQAKRIVLSSTQLTELDLDGEAGAYLPATIEVVPQALRFLAPPQPVGAAPSEPRP